jgi:cobyrinic acid a,c-diamide synthase
VGARLRGHEFHYSQVTPAAGEVPAWSLRARGLEVSEGFAGSSLLASYLHTHWAATPEVCDRLLASAAEVPALGGAHGAPR